MSQEKIKDTIRKLFTHEKSARDIGNAAEADAYKNHASKLMKKHRIKKKDLAEKTAVGVASISSTNIKGFWKCNCGASFELSVAGSAAGVDFVNMILAPHTVNGHILTKIS